MYCSCWYRSICLRLCLLFHRAIVEFLAQSRRREPLLSSRVQNYFWGEDSNGYPFAFPAEPLKVAFPGRPHIHVDGGNDT